MRISVVIATYNRASLLETSLGQLRNQQYAPGDDVIVVDNGSTDGTADVIARAAREFPVPLHQLSEPTPGKTAALIAGLAVARGDVVALTDDDVLVSGNWISTIRHLFTNSTAALVGGRVDPLWERPAPRWLRVEADDQGRYGAMCSPLALLHYGEAQELGARTAVGANLAVRRRVLESLGGVAPHLGRQRGTLLCGEDHDLCQRAVAAGFRCEYRPELRVRHWVPASRMRFRYFLRWFFWSGVTHATLDRANAGGAGRPAGAPHFLRRLAIASLAAAAQALAGRLPEAAESLMDAAFAVGYLTARINERKHREGVGTPQRQEPAAARKQAGVHG